jgi:F0F1-type ATP synthase assembly protein I
MVAAPPSSPQGPSIWRHLLAGTTLAITILAFIYAGYWIDHRHNSSPWGVCVGAFVGLGVGLFNFLREFRDDQS